MSFTGQSSPHINQFISNLRKDVPFRPQVPSLHEIRSICGLSDEDIIDETKKGRDYSNVHSPHRPRSAAPGSRRKRDSNPAASSRNNAFSPHVSSSTNGGLSKNSDGEIPFKSLIPVEDTLGKKNFEKMRKKYRVQSNSPVTRRRKRPHSTSSTRHYHRVKSPHYASQADSSDSYKMMSPVKAAFLERKICARAPIRTMVIQELDTKGRKLTPRIKNKPKKRIEERTAVFEDDFRNGPRLFSVEVGKRTTMRIEVKGAAVEQLYVGTEKQYRNGELGLRTMRKSNFLACVNLPGIYYINKSQGQYFFCVTGSRRKEFQQDQPLEASNGGTKYSAIPSHFTLNVTIGVDPVSPFDDLGHISHLLGAAGHYSIRHERKLSALVAESPSDVIFMTDKTSGNTLLHVACREVTIRSVNLLLKRGIHKQHLNQQNDAGDTPLMVLVKSANRTNEIIACNIMELLFQVGFLDANIQNQLQGNNTALHFAAESDTDSGRILYTLRSIGARTNIRNDDKRTALQVASLYGNTRAVEVLEARIQKLMMEFDGVHQ